MSVLHPVLDVLAQAPILTVFLVIGLGTAAGQIPLGPIRFGAAGALFVGLAVGALDPRLGANLTLLRSLGLALFCYTVGLGAGNTFFRDLRRQLPLMALCVVALVIAGAAGGLYSHLTGVSPAMDSGAYAGALTSPVLDAAIEAAGTQAHGVAEQRQAEASQQGEIGAEPGVEGAHREAHEKGPGRAEADRPQRDLPGGGPQADDEEDGEDRRLREDVENGMEHGHDARLVARPECPEPHATNSPPGPAGVMREAAKRPPEALFNRWDKWC